jgi:hypothetical protein
VKENRTDFDSECVDRWERGYVVVLLISRLDELRFFNHSSAEWILFSFREIRIIESDIYLCTAVVIASNRCKEWRFLSTAMGERQKSVKISLFPPHHLSFYLSPLHSSSYISYLYYFMSFSLHFH